MRASQIRVCFCLIAVLLLSNICLSQAPVGNSDPTYTQLRDLRLGQESILTENLVLTREFATFTFRTGNIYFAAPVNGKVTGAVFVGNGSLSLKPESAAEKRNLSILTKSSDFNEHFEVVVLRFTDGTYEELKKAAKPGPNSGALDRASGAFAGHLETMRKDRVARYNESARILQDVLSPNSSGYFAAYIHGKNYNDKEAFIIDPQGITAWNLQPEEVAFLTHDEEKYGIWAVSHLQAEQAKGTAKGSEINGPIDLISQKLDAELRKSGEMKVSATTTFAALRDGLRAAPFSIFRNFSIDSVTDESGQALAYVFEKRSWYRNEDDDADNLTVILPKPLAKGEKFTVKLVYGGKEAISNEGNGNYYPIARHDWYPSTRWGDYAAYEMTFHIPKTMKIAATGTLLSEKTEGDWNVTEWKSEGPIGVAGFNFGKFKVLEQKSKNGFVIQACANIESPDSVTQLQNIATGRLPGSEGDTSLALGSMDTTSMMKKPLAEAQIAMGLYSDYFGPIDYKRLEMTQQTACNYGQAWPGLVWLPICSYFDATVRHQVIGDDFYHPYWNVVASHEIAHQWWGHTVGWASYRDQWMSEGFAQLSASIFAQAVYSPTDKGAMYQRIWQGQQKSLQDKNRYGFRPIDVGPLTMGYRLNSTKTGSIYNTLIYGKGSFVLHMLRMMMWDNQKGDQAFKEMMRDFAATYHNQAASTEDFKAIVEKHMTRGMDQDGNGRMDWFFNEWIYGTELPKYNFTYTLENDPGGAKVLSFKLTQSGVSAQFKMRVPVYVEMTNGDVRYLGSANLAGNTTVEKKVPLGNMQPKRAMINYNYDVLSQE